MRTRTMPTEHTERVRELAELRVQGHVVDRNVRTGETFATSLPLRYLPDPRFASLRAEHEWDSATEWEAECKRCGVNEGTLTPPLCLREDGDALDEAIAACGWDLLLTRSDGVWEATVIQDWNFAGEWEPSVRAEGPTPREAKSAALWQAVMS